QAVSVRLLLRQPAEQLAAMRELLSLHFEKDDSLTRARIRMSLEKWNLATTLIWETRNWARASFLRLPPDDNVKKPLIAQLRESKDAEDRFLSGLLEISWSKT